MNGSITRLAVVLGTLLLTSPSALAQGSGSGGGGDNGSGCGDLFGDLVHVLRDAQTGVPILQKRWVAGPKDVYAWAYCPIALDAAGQELGFLPDSCDLDPATGTAVAVDYFGRLSAGRTKERNIRMHFDEVVDKIKASQAVSRDQTGRLLLGTSCTSVTPAAATCFEWTLVDSPVENIALYHRLMKYGHYQTDPAEVDTSAHGDPALPTQLHPALDPAVDYAKFTGATRALLPDACATAPCAAPQALTNEDFALAASFLATGADKDGRITVDLVRYMDRILKIPVATPESAAALKLLPAKVRDCGSDPAQQLTPASACPVADAAPGLPAPASERFVDFGPVSYLRTDSFSTTVEAIKPADTLGLNRLRTLALMAVLRTPIDDVWVIDPSVSLLEWLDVRNGLETNSGVDVTGFVNSANDALRCIEFVHNYAVPLNLGWNFK